MIFIFLEQCFSTYGLQPGSWRKKGQSVVWSTWGPKLYPGVPDVASQSPPVPRIVPQRSWELPPCPVLSGSRSRRAGVTVFWFGISERCNANFRSVFLASKRGSKKSSACLAVGSPLRCRPRTVSSVEGKNSSASLTVLGYQRVISSVNCYQIPNINVKVFLSHWLSLFSHITDDINLFRHSCSIFSSGCAP